MRAIYENEIIGDPFYAGLGFGGLEEFLASGDFEKADWPGLRAVRIGGAWTLAADLPDTLPITVTGGGSLFGVPVGAILPYGGSSSPSGWLKCDGSAVSRTTYTELFAAIGTAYGVGDGSTTFNVPDYRDRFPVGSGSTYTPGATGGAATVALTEANLGSHDHTITHTHSIDPASTASGTQSASHTHSGTSAAQSASHTHLGSSLTTESQTTGSSSHTHAGPAGELARSISGGGSSAATGAIAGSTGNQSASHTHTLTTGNQSASHTHTIDIASFTSGASSAANTGNAGSGTAHENRPPYLAALFIICASVSSPGVSVELWY